MTYWLNLSFINKYTSSETYINVFNVINILCLPTNAIHYSNLNLGPLNFSCDETHWWHTETTSGPDDTFNLISNCHPCYTLTHQLLWFFTSWKHKLLLPFLLKRPHSCGQLCIKRKYSRRKQENNPVIRSEYIIAWLLPSIADLSLDSMQITRIYQTSSESTNQQNAYRFDHTAPDIQLSHHVRIFQQ